MMSVLEEAKKVAQVRGNVYSLLSQCFFQPSEELVASITKDHLSESLQHTVGLLDGEKVERELVRIKDFSAKSKERLPEEILRDMKVEYNRLFVGPGHLLAPPYESVYKTKDEDTKTGVVMGDDTIAAKKLYHRAGLELDDNFRDLPDHIAVELYFMSYLCNLESINADEGEDSIDRMTNIKELQREFLNSHLGTWISDFSQTVDSQTNSEFYRGIANLTEKWVLSEINELA